MYNCPRCDFCTNSPSEFRNHLKDKHQDIENPDLAYLHAGSTLLHSLHPSVTDCLFIHLFPLCTCLPFPSLICPSVSEKSSLWMSWFCVCAFWSLCSLWFSVHTHIYTLCVKSGTRKRKDEREWKPCCVWGTCVCVYGVALVDWQLWLLWVCVCHSVLMFLS